MWDVWLVVMCGLTAGLGLDSDELSLLLLQENPGPGGLLVQRRITPKSVFVAPSFCSEGYRQDSMGRCVKVVRVNPAAQWDFLLQKLNAAYAEPAAPSNKPSGPLRLPIPLATEAPTLPPPPPTTTTTTPPETSTQPPETTTTEAEEGEDEERTTQQETTTTPPTTEPTTTETPRCATQVNGDGTVEDCIPSESSPKVRFPTEVRFPDSQAYWWPQGWEGYRLDRYPTSYQRLHHFHSWRPRRPHTRPQTAQY